MLVRHVLGLQQLRLQQAAWCLVASISCTCAGVKTTAESGRSGLRRSTCHTGVTGRQEGTRQQDQLAHHGHDGRDALQISPGDVQGGLLPRGSGHSQDRNAAVAGQVRTEGIEGALLTRQTLARACCCLRAWSQPQLVCLGAEQSCTTAACAWVRHL